MLVKINLEVIEMKKIVSNNMVRIDYLITEATKLCFKTIHLWDTVQC